MKDVISSPSPSTTTAVVDNAKAEEKLTNIAERPGGWLAAARIKLRMWFGHLHIDVLFERR